LTIATSSADYLPDHVGIINCIAKPVHKGRTTQVWDAEVCSDETGKKIAFFRCTQMVLWPKK
jgi:acyl-coenzyme A thioesterase PaaI-like protein